MRTTLSDSHRLSTDYFLSFNLWFRVKRTRTTYQACGRAQELFSFFCMFFSPPLLHSKRSSFPFIYRPFAISRLREVRRIGEILLKNGGQEELFSGDIFDEVSGDPIEHFFEFEPMFLDCFCGVCPLTQERNVENRDGTDQARDHFLVGLGG